MNKKRIYIISSTLLLIGLFAGVVQYVGMFDAIYAAATNPGHSWSQMECSTALCIDTTNNRVGVGTMTPQTTFDVNGAIKIGESATCNASSTGSIKTKEGFVWICNGTEWKRLENSKWDESFSCPTSFVDSRDGKRYNTVEYTFEDGQRACWMKENLAYLPSVNNLLSYSNTGSRYYVYGYDGTSVSTAKATSNYKNYGALYNHVSAATACPAGWRLPTSTEFHYLEEKFTIPDKSCEHYRLTGDCWGAGVELRDGGTSNFDVKVDGSGVYSANCSQVHQFSSNNSTYWTSTNDNLNYDPWVGAGFITYIFSPPILDVNGRIVDGSFQVGRSKATFACSGFYVRCIKD